MTNEKMEFNPKTHKCTPVPARCCVAIDGLLCGKPAEYEASPDRLDRAAAYKRSLPNGVLTWDRAPLLVYAKKRWDCGDHAWDVCQPCLAAPYKASGERYVRRRDFAKVVDVVSAAATPAPEPLAGGKTAGALHPRGGPGGSGGRVRAPRRRRGGGTAAPGGAGRRGGRDGRNMTGVIGRGAVPAPRAAKLDGGLLG